MCKPRTEEDIINELADIAYDMHMMALQNEDVDDEVLVRKHELEDLLAQMQGE